MTLAASGLGLFVYNLHCILVYIGVCSIITWWLLLPHVTYLESREGTRIEDKRGGSMMYIDRQGNKNSCKNDLHLTTTIIHRRRRLLIVERLINADSSGAALVLRISGVFAWHEAELTCQRQVIASPFLHIRPVFSRAHG